MWPETLTPCVCAQPGWCARHRCLKTATLHLLCRRQQAYFDAWERGEGPCVDQFFTDPPPVDAPAPAGPGTVRRLWNFGQAVVRHMADGVQRVDEPTYQARLDTCRACASCDVGRMVCREPTCGCFLKTKASWRSEACPLGKWSAVAGPGVPEPPSAVTESS